MKMRQENDLRSGSKFADLFIDKKDSVKIVLQIYLSQRKTAILGGENHVLGQPLPRISPITLPTVKTGVEERARQVRQGWRLAKSALYLEGGGKESKGGINYTNGKTTAGQRWRERKLIVNKNSPEVTGLGAGSKLSSKAERPKKGRSTEKIQQLERAHSVSDRNICKTSSPTGKWNRSTPTLQLIPSSSV